MTNTTDDTRTGNTKLVRALVWVLAVVIVLEAYATYLMWGIRIFPVALAIGVIIAVVGITALIIDDAGYALLAPFLAFIIAITASLPYAIKVGSVTLAITIILASMFTVALIIAANLDSRRILCGVQVLTTIFLLGALILGPPDLSIYEEKIGRSITTTQ